METSFADFGREHPKSSHEHLSRRFVKEAHYLGVPDKMSTNLVE